MKPYILGITFNVLLLGTLYLIGMYQRNDYGIFFEISITILTILYCIAGIFILLRFIIYKAYQKNFSIFIMTFYFIVIALLLNQLRTGMSYPYYLILISNIV